MSRKRSRSTPVSSATESVAPVPAATVEPTPTVASPRRPVRALLAPLLGPAALLGLGGVAGFALGWVVFAASNDAAKGGNVPHAVRQNSSEYRYINPLLECESDRPSRTARLRLMQEEIEREIARLQSTRGAHQLAVYYRELDNGPWIGFDQDTAFTPASLLKVPVMITVLKQADQDPTLLSRRVLVTSVDERGYEQNFAVEERARAGVEYSVYDLLRLMIVHSDNHASNALMRVVEAPQLQQTFEQIGLEVDLLSGRDVTLSVRDYASFFRVLYNASYLSRQHSELALSLLADSSFDDGLVAGTGRSVEVAHKYGERVLDDVAKVTQVHDCGIVYYPDHPYLLCIMTRGRDIEQLTSVIRDVAEVFYRELEQQRIATTSAE